MASVEHNAGKTGCHTGYCYGGLPQALQASTGTAPEFRHNRFLPDPFQFITRQSFQHLRYSDRDTDSIVKSTNKINFRIMRQTSSGSVHLTFLRVCYMSCPCRMSAVGMTISLSHLTPWDFDLCWLQADTTASGQRRLCSSSNQLINNTICAL
jgi:hypothetical protein